MKRILIAAILLVLLTTPLVSQTSEYYPIRVDVIKVYSHAEGMRVIYRSGSTGFADAYIPASWFTAGGKAELVSANDPSYPYMTVFYKNGAFSHVRLYVKASTSDSSWGVLPPEAGRGKFDIEELKLKF
jgi:hypothetical protein